MVPFGTMPVQRRPRIPDQLTRDIDQLRGREPYESFVRNALDWYVQIMGTVAGKGRMRAATGPEILMHLIANDFWNADQEQFKADVDEALRMWGEKLDEFAVDQEFDE